MGQHSDLPLCDTETLGILGGDEPLEILEVMIPAFLDDAVGHVDAIAHSSQSQDINQLGDAAHKLAGVAASFGAVRLHQLAQTIDVAAKTGDTRTALDEAPALPNLYKETKQAFEGYLKNLH